MEKLSSFYKSITNKELSDLQISQFETYYEMLVEKNKVMNLTAITQKDEVILKHFIDSIALAKFVDLTKDYKIIDVGTGAGFPGLPLKIAFPNLKLTLFDSLNKRVVFLQEVVEKLNLDNCCCIHGRAEEGGRNNNLRESFDFVLSRAVANMAVLSEYCIPFVKQDGYFIPYKAGEIEEELDGGKRAISTLGGTIEKIQKMILPDSDISRSFIFIKKEKRTPKAYPRKAGTATKQPL